MKDITLHPPVQEKKFKAINNYFKIKTMYISLFSNPTPRILSHRKTIRQEKMHKDANYSTVQIWRRKETK